MPYEVQALRYPQNDVIATERFDHFPDATQTTRLASVSKARFVVLHDGAIIAKMRNKQALSSFMTCISCVEHVFHNA